MTLISQAIAGFVFVMLVTGTTLFLSAGSFAFWQAWVWATGALGTYVHQNSTRPATVTRLA
jgi:hypothetical protein